MKISIRQTTYKTVHEDVEMEVPENKMFFFITGERVSYSVKPVWTTWNKEQYQKDEEIYSYDIVAVSRCYSRSIEKSNVTVGHFPDIIKQGEKNKYFRVVDLLLKPDQYNVRTEEQFMADYNAVLTEIKESL